MSEDQKAIYRMVMKWGSPLHETGLEDVEAYAFDGNAVMMNHKHKIGRFHDNLYSYLRNRRAYMDTTKHLDRMLS